MISKVRIILPAVAACCQGNSAQLKHEHFYLGQNFTKKNLDAQDIFSCWHSLFQCSCSLLGKEVQCEINQGVSLIQWILWVWGRIWEWGCNVQLTFVYLQICPDSNFTSWMDHILHSTQHKQRLEVRVATDFVSPVIWLVLACPASLCPICVWSDAWQADRSV